jgi:hypothetical protein
MGWSSVQELDTAPPPSNRSETIGKQRRLVWLLVALLVAGLIVALSRYYPVGVDWRLTYAAASGHWRDPYSVPSFTNPPWIMALLPHAWLPVQWGNAVNLVLNITLVLAVIARFRGGWPLMALVFTSPPFLDLVRTNNVDWIPLLALLLPAPWGLPLLALKPQALGGVALIWWKRSRSRLRLLAPLAAVVLLSFLVWGFWPGRLWSPQNTVWNFAPWPFGLPLGAYMLYRAYRSDDAFLAAAASPFLVPYIAPYSVAGLLAFAGSKYRREAFIVYVAFWIYFVVETRRIGLMF